MLISSTHIPFLDRTSLGYLLSSFALLFIRTLCISSTPLFSHNHITAFLVLYEGAGGSSLA